MNLLALHEELNKSLLVHGALGDGREGKLDWEALLARLEQADASPSKRIAKHRDGI